MKAPSTTSKQQPAGRQSATAADVRTAHLEGRSIAALARDHRVSRGTIRTAVADLLPNHAAIEGDAPAHQPVTLDMPGKVADHLRTTELKPTALDQGTPAQHDQSYTLRVSTIPYVHRQLLTHRQPLDGGHGLPANPDQGKARREYENRVSPLSP